MPDYSLGKVYKIVCNITGEIYVGSTVEKTLARRLGGHVCSFKRYKNGENTFSISSFSIIERDNYYIELLENTPCNSKDELMKKEREWYNKLNCVNKKRPHITPEEDKQTNINRVKQWTENNRTYSKQYHQLYHMSKIPEYSMVVNCDCGCSFTKRNKQRHQKTKKHLKYLELNPTTTTTEEEETTV